jgi:type 1 glutamine amidotransferase
VPGLEALLDADALVLSMRRRALPVAQMDHLERFIRAGKPIVAIRVSVVPFQVRAQDRPAGHVLWQDFDQEVLGCHYRGYPGGSRETGCDVWVAGAAGEHPIVRHVEPKRFHSPSWLYNLRPLAPGTKLLLEGRWKEGEPEQPVAFTNIYEGARVFYTSLGHAGDFANPAFNEMLRNAVYWVLEMDVPGGGTR